MHASSLSFFLVGAGKIIATAEWEIFVGATFAKIPPEAPEKFLTVRQSPCSLVVISGCNDQRMLTY